MKKDLIEFDRLLDAAGQSLLRTFSARHEEIRRCTSEMRKTLEFIRQRGWKTHESIWNACLFLNRVSHDHSMLLVSLAKERDEDERRLTARKLALVLYEIAEDLPAVFGKAFRLSIETLRVPTELLSPLNDSTRKVGSFWRDHRSLLKQLRTVAAAHRDHDAVVLCNTIEGIDLFHLLKISLELGNMMNELGASAQAIVTYTASVRPPELAMPR